MTTMQMTPTVEMIPIDLPAIEAARDRIAGVVHVTPCHESLRLSELTGSRVFCKLEYLQRTGNFKERGAANTLAMLDRAQIERGVIAASSGNHAQALSHHGRRMGVPVTVVMPSYAPLIKAASCRKMGATVVMHGSSFAEARAHADELAASQGLAYIHGYDDPRVIAGQGTIGLELLEQVPDLDAVLVPIGGGGLIAGIATAIKAKAPGVQVIGLEPARSPCFTEALKAGHPVPRPVRPTLADGLSVTQTGDNAFATARDKIDKIVGVEEAELAMAVLRLLELEKAVVEGAGASPLAAMLGGQLPELKGKTIAMVLSGGNIDPLTLRRVIEHGLAADGRMHRLCVDVSDRPGGLADLSRVLADVGVCIQDVHHDRLFAGPDVARVRMQLVLETRDHAHFEQARAALREQGFTAEVPNF